MNKVRYNPAPPLPEPALLIEDGSKKVLMALPDSAYLPANVEGTTPIYGETADLLYQAITGHGITQSPVETSTFRARAARAVLQSRQRLLWPETILANEVVAQWGDHILPWFGMCLFNTDTNEPEFNLEIYRTVIKLTNNRAYPSAESFVAWSRS